MPSDREIGAALAAFHAVEGEMLPTGSVVPPSTQERMRAALSAAATARPDPPTDEAGRDVHQLLDLWIAVYKDEQEHGADHRRILHTLNDIKRLLPASEEKLRQALRLIRDTTTGYASNVAARTLAECAQDAFERALGEGEGER